MEISTTSGLLKSLSYNENMNKLIQYLKESRAELMKVVWPSRKQTRDHTAMVIAISISVAIFLGALDYLFEQIIVKTIVK